MKEIKTICSAVVRVVSKGAGVLGFRDCRTDMSVSGAGLSGRDQPIARLYEQGASSKPCVWAYRWRWLGWAGTVVWWTAIIVIVVGCVGATKRWGVTYVETKSATKDGLLWYRYRDVCVMEGEDVVGLVKKIPEEACDGDNIYQKR